MRRACRRLPARARGLGLRAGPEGAGFCPALSPARSPTRGRSSVPPAPQAKPGQAKPSGAPGKQAAKAKMKAKAAQAGKLRNSAKGKVPKSALGKVGKGPGVLPPGPGCALEGGDLEAGDLEGGDLEGGDLEAGLGTRVRHS